MLEKINKVILHYFLSIILSLYPVVIIFIHNFKAVKINQIFLPVLIIIITVSLLFCILYFLYRRSQVIAIIIPFIIIALFTYNNLHQLLVNNNYLLPIGKNRILLPIYLIAIYLFLSYTLKASILIRKVLLSFLIILNLMPILFNLDILSKPKINANINESLIANKYSENKTYPDIFFIVLDMYPSNYVLKKFFNFDNSNFTKKLEDYGFNIFYNSNSSYSRTLLTLTSTFNMEYIHNEKDSVSKELSLDYLYKKLENGKVQSYFKNKGYSFYWFEGGYLPARKNTNNEFYIDVKGELFSSRDTPDNDFLLLFINNSILAPFSEKINIIAADIYRKRIHNIFNKIPSLANINKSKFIYAHVMAPHPPYIFGSNGEKLYYTENSLNRKTAFINQLKYLNIRVLNLIDTLTNIKNGREKIIIIQGDHGTREIKPNTNYSFSQNWTQEAFGNLNSIYFSNRNLYSRFVSVSNINTFRIIINNEFGEKLKLLEEKSYYTDFKFPLKIHRIHN